MNLLQELIDILKCKVLLVTGRLDYPLSILPKNQYIERIDIDKLYKHVPLVVVRRSDKPKEEIFNEIDLLREDVITKSDIPRMSMNLLGGAFKQEHIKFNPIGESCRIWDGSEKVFFSNYRKSIRLLPVATPIFFEVANLHDKEFPYKRNKDPTSNKLMNALAYKPSETEGKFILYGKSYISHEPTLLNYWHVEFQIKDFEKKLIEKAKSAWQKEAAESAFLHIQTSALPECPNIKEIPKSYFWK